MSEKYKVIFHDKPNFITLTVVVWDVIKNKIPELYEQIIQVIGKE